MRDRLDQAVGEGGWRGWRIGGRLPVSVALVAVAAAIVIVVVDPFGAGGGLASRVAGNRFATSLVRIADRGLSAQTQVSGALGFAGDWTIRVAAGTPPGAVAQAQGSVSADQRRLDSARSLLVRDQLTLANAQATVVADRQRLAVDCAGDNAARSSGRCAGDAQLLSGDRPAQTEAATIVGTGKAQVSAAETSLARARSALVSAQARETAYGPNSVFTSLPPPGQVVFRGRQLYAIDGWPVLLLYGSAVARRAFVVGMSPGADVAELNANLNALGYGRGLAGTSFTAGTAAAIRALQRARGMSVTGVLPLGSVVFAPGAVRVKSVSPNSGVGSTVSPGPLLTVSSTRRVVTVALDASLEGEVKVGDPAIITLPDNTTTPGRISFVSKVATTGQNGTTIAVQVTPNHPTATGTVDQAPVNVQITTARVQHALVVPVNALVALSGGGYAVEEVARGRQVLVAIRIGLFDDADGLVQIRGAGLAAGQRVVVPGS